MWSLSKRSLVSKRGPNTILKAFVGSKVPGGLNAPPLWLDQDGGKPPFNKILVANRGEIAIRVFQTCKKLGISTVAVFSDADAKTKFVNMADEAIHIGPPPSSESYLQMDRILEAVRLTGAEAVHPGYGFLSENAEFSKALKDAGVAFIGPPEQAMDDMGDKIHSKQIAIDAGVTIIPGYQGEIETPEDAVRIANDIGYPVMIKASAGGGGKGMRVAYTDDETREGFMLSKQEAKASFGDDRMLVEKFIENPHHIEIQVLADAHGNVAAFPERECSIQRRNQKVVEEAPSCLIQPETRRRMQEQAKMLCKKVEYRSAGTIELLCDEQQNFYFLEMNTRLQVEHPVTEAISGQDLVEHMIYIAAGRPLPDSLLATDGFLDPVGHAIESRVYAEDPLRGFLPSTGTLHTYREPEDLLISSESGEPISLDKAADYTRVDSGILEGAEISMHYDPMISKLITYGDTRDDAIQHMNWALTNYPIRGLRHNIGFLMSVLQNDTFQGGNTSTKFIGEEYPDGYQQPKLSLLQDYVVSGITGYLNKMSQIVPLAEDSGDDYMEDLEHELVISLNGLKGHPINVGIVDATPVSCSVNVSIPASSELGEDLSPVYDKASTCGLELRNISWGTSPVFQCTVVVDKNTLGEIEAADPEGTKKYLANTPTREITIFDQATGQEVNAVEFKAVACYDGQDNLDTLLRIYGKDVAASVFTPSEYQYNQYLLKEEEVDVSKILQAPMPGKIISIDVAPGDEVQEGQRVAIMEAMKMQTPLHAPKQTKVTSVSVGVGDTVKVDQVILQFE